MNEPRQDDPLYPEIEPYKVSSLEVSDLHTVVYEEVGNPDGRPALFLHGGPGVGISPGYRRFFDPSHYRIVLLDQRGAGRSTPHSEIRENTMQHIIDDLESLKNHLGIEDWVVMGGSWGSILALCYAIRHPDSVAGMIIRGIFLGRQFEIDWLYGSEGAARIYPDEYEKFRAPVGNARDTVAAYCEILNGDDERAMSAARAWARWEGVMNTLFPDEEQLGQMLDDNAALSIARIESHFASHNFYVESDNYVLDNADVLAKIPTRIVHGRYDTICPPISAWQLHKALKKSTLKIVAEGAHSPMDHGMAKELVRASDEFRDAGV